jgi:sulfur-carrier protein
MVHSCDVVYKSDMPEMPEYEPSQTRQDEVTVTFAASLQRHIPCPPQKISVATLREVLKAALLAAPDLSHYIFDDQGNIRKHVAVFINRDMLQNRADLTQTLNAGDQVLVVQALTGG